MEKDFLKISSLDAHYLLSLLKTARPRKKHLRAESAAMLERLSVQLTGTNQKDLIAESVRQAIRETVGPQAFTDTTTLASLLFDNPTYAELASRLTIIAQGYEAKATISRNEVINAKTVGGCISLTQTRAGVV